jgi:hypothetical protein
MSLGNLLRRLVNDLDTQWSNEAMFVDQATR